MIVSVSRMMATDYNKIEEVIALARDLGDSKVIRTMGRSNYNIVRRNHEVGEDQILVWSENETR